MTAFGAGMNWEPIDSSRWTHFTFKLFLTFLLSFTQLTVNGWYHADEATLLYGWD
jgi:hypothetical protein